jgi:hypothetical protein
MEVVQIQFAVFFKNIFTGMFENLILDLKTMFGNGLQTQQIPLDNGVPVEIPRVIINFRGFQINISLMRMDIILTTPDADRLIQQLNKFPFSKHQIDIARIGYVKTVFIKNKGTNDIKRIFIPDLQTQNITELSFRLNIPFEYLDHKCNNIEDYNETQQIVHEENHVITGLMIQKDLNTVPINTNMLDEELRKNLLSEFQRKSTEFIINQGSR